MHPHPIDRLFINFEQHQAFQGLLPNGFGDGRQDVNFNDKSVKTAKGNAKTALKSVHDSFIQDWSKEKFVTVIRKMLDDFSTQIESVKRNLPLSDLSSLTTAQKHIKTAIEFNALCGFIQIFANEFYMYLDAVMVQVDKLRGYKTENQKLFTAKLKPEDDYQKWTEILHKLGICTAAPETTADPNYQKWTICTAAPECGDNKVWLYVGGGSILVLVLVLALVMTTRRRPRCKRMAVR